MDILHSLSEIPKLKTASLCIGHFDGVHLGHQAILSAAHGQGSPVIALTFKTAPKKILAPVEFLGDIMPYEIKARTLKSFGVDILLALDFEEVRNISAVRFVKMLKRRIAKLSITTGTNFRFGRKNTGDSELLETLSQKHGFIYQSVRPVTCCLWNNPKTGDLMESGKIDSAIKNLSDGERISSTLIRNLIFEGKVSHAAQLLGRPYFYYSQKITGDRLGRTIGFPTLNQNINDQVLPKEGVYSTLFLYNQKFLPSMSYIGTRPVVHGTELRMETNILDFDEHLPEKEYAVLFMERIRDEKTFQNLEELKKTLYNDRQFIRDYPRSDRVTPGMEILFE